MLVVVAFLCVAQVDAVDPLPAGLTRPADDVPPPDASAPEPREDVDRIKEDELDVRLRMKKLAFLLAEELASRGGRFSTLAVLPFEQHGAVDASTPDQQLGPLVAAELATFLARDHGQNVVERARIESVLQEIYLSETGVTDAASAVKLGELLAAQALVVGDVALAGDKYLVNARILSTESGLVVAAEQIEVPAAGLVGYAADAVLLRTRTGAVFRSALIPGWGQMYNREELKGWIILGGELALLGAAGSLQVAGALRHDDYVKSGDASLLAFERSLYESRNVLLLGAAGVWAYALVDAFIFGQGEGSN